MNDIYSTVESDEKNLKEVVEKVKLGEKQAYTLIISHYQKPIFLYCFYLLRNREEAEDATQDIFIKGLQCINSFVQTVSFSAWIYRIAHNHCTDLLKKKSKSYKSLNQYRINKEQEEETRYSDFINELLDMLNLEEKQILLLRSLEDYSYDEIASIMDLKTTTVRKKYERLRKKLIYKKGMGTYESSTKTGG